MNIQQSDFNPSALLEALKKAIHSVFIGKEESVHILLLSFFSGLHVLLEDIPGVGKTTLARSLAASTGLDFGRIQFTPDILPGDILGMTVWSQEKKDFVFKPGAIMHQFILADEINRASPRTQAALLEAMQERKVTVDGISHLLPDVFFVVATQNPVSFSGTFSLPEAETDRFGVCLSLGYPSQSEETEILERFKEDDPEEQLEVILSGTDIPSVRKAIRAVHVSERISAYLVAISKATRHSPLIRLGMSPRATQHLMLVSQAQAYFSNRDFVVPEDVQLLCNAVLRHRMHLSAEARMDNLDISAVIRQVLASVSVPSGV